MWSDVATNVLRGLDPVIRKLARPRKEQRITHEHIECIQKLISEYRLPGFCSGVGKPPSRALEVFSRKFFNDHVLSRTREEAIELLNQLLVLPIHPATRAHIWVTSLFGLSESEVRKEVDQTRRLIGGNSEMWCEVQRVLRDQLSTANDVRALEYLRQIAGMMPLPPAPPPPPPPPQTLRLEHPMSSRTERADQPVTQAARLVWKHLAEDMGMILCPVRLAIPATVAAETVTIVVDHSALTIEVADEPRIRQFGRNESKLDLCIELRVRRQALTGKGLSLALNVIDAGYQWRTNSVHWDEPLFGMPALVELLPDAVDPERVRVRPLGVETRFNDIRDLLKSDKSILISAPRRFGKTSLLKALSSDLDNNPEVRLFGPYDALLHPRGDEFWNPVFDSFKNDFGCTIDRRLDAMCGLPSHAAFDDIRTEARKRGIIRIFLLIDEAQELFRGAGGTGIGNELKSRLEHWGIKNERQSGLHVLLCGTSNLQRLMGANLAAAMTDNYGTSTIDEFQILSLLRDTKNESGLQSTREARERLAEVSCNLMILNRVIEKMQSTLRQAGKTWIFGTEVNDAVENILADFKREGEDNTMWQYVRDILNASDDVNHWKPRHLYIVAVALAGANTTQNSLDARRTEVLRLLREWDPGACIALNRIKKEIEKLRDEQVVDHLGNFQWEIFGKMLALRAKSPQGIREEERKLIRNLGVDEVDLPPAVLSGERTAGGGTASILDRQVDGRRAAIRLLHIEDHAARERFVREVQLLRELNEEAVGKEVGLYIPALRQAGFLKADSNQGVVVYDWVDGKSLFQACLSPFSIARIGLALARVLAFFGKNDVVHRDIKPANIIASPPTDPTESEDVRPVLIDFGLARHILPGRFTNIPGTEGFIPPEVCHGADWMPAGDVFSLGRTLQCMLPAGDRGLETPRLMCLIRQMAHTEPSQRPVGSRLVKEFEGIIDEEVKHKRMKWVRETLGEIPTCCAPIAAQIDSFAVSVRDGLVPLPDWMIWLSYLLESAVGGLIRERSQLKNALETKKGENKWSTYLLQGDLIADIDQTFACLRKRSAKTAGHLRNAHGHPIDRDSKIREVARFLRVDQLPDRTKYEHIMCSIGEACQCVDTLIGITPGLFSKLYELARQAAGARH